MENFIFQNPVKLIMGRGMIARLAKEIPSDKRIMITFGGGSVKKNGVYDQVKEALKNHYTVEFWGIEPNPAIETLRKAIALGKEEKVDYLLAVGGGSVIDGTKLISAGILYDGDAWDLVLAGRPVTHTVPLATVLTLPATGSEMNNGAVITHEAKKIKTGILGAQAEFAFLDPIYSMSVPIKQVISGAFDTLSHAMETYFGKPEQNNLSDDMNEAVMRSVIHNIRKLLAAPESYNARSELAWASAMAENGILKVGRLTDFQAHQIEHQLGAYTGCNHGKGLAVIHPVLYRHICAANPARFARFAENVWGIQDSGTDSLRTVRLVKAGIEALAAFIKEIGLPTTFAELGIPEDTDLRAVADSTNITAGCCKKLTHDEIYEILLECR